MKKYILLMIMLLVSLSPLFRGLFFPLEMYIFFAALSLLAAIYFIIKLVRKEKIFVGHRAAYAGVGLVLSYIFSFSSSVYYRGNADTLIQYATYFIVFLAAADFFKDNAGKISGFFILPVIVVGFIAALIGLEGYTRAFPLLIDTLFGGRLGSTFEYTNTAAVYFLTCLLLTLSFIINTKNPLLKAILAGMGNTVFLALFFTGSRGTFLIAPFILILYVLLMPSGSRLKSAGYSLLVTIPILVALKGYGANAQQGSYIEASQWILVSFAASAVLVLLYCSTLLRFNIGKKTRYALLVSALAIPVIMLFIYTKPAYGVLKPVLADIIPANIMERLTTISFGTGTAVARYAMDLDAIKLIKQTGFLGLGGGGWSALYQSVQDYFYTARAVHNHYLQVFVEAGIFGFIFFILFTLITGVYFLYALIRNRSVEARVWIGGCTCAFAALAVHSPIDFDLTYSAVALIFWCLAGVSGAYLHTSVKTEKIETGKANKVIAAVLVLVGISLSGVNTAAATAAWYSNQGDNYRDKAKITEAIKCYEAAASIDNTNAAYYSKLAENCNLAASFSSHNEEMSMWRGKALSAAEKAVKYNAFYPYYNYLLAQVYFDANQNIKAYEQADRLTKLQPGKTKNYELLARGYMEAGLQYLRAGNTKRAKELMVKCSQMGNSGAVKLNSSTAFYKGKALLLMGDYSEAENLLNKARQGSLSLKMDSDRLLYIINQETDREDQNSKFKHVLWMGMVESTAAYKEVKSVIAGKLLN